MRWMQLLITSAFTFFFLLFSSSLYSATVVAHKGLTNPFPYEQGGCHAQNLSSIDHHYIENTIASVEESFRMGADVVEVDFRLTKDKRLVLFQMETLDCQTNGKGRVDSFTASELTKIRTDWNLSSDGGKTFPWRSRRPQYIETFNDLLKVTGCRPLMLNPKDKKIEEAIAIVKALKPMNCDWSKFAYWGGMETYQFLKKELPGFGPFIPNPYFMFLCNEAYKGLGAFGIWPDVCKKDVIQVDLKELTWNLWGWPFEYIKLARQNGSKVWVYGANDNQLLRTYYPLVDGVITSSLYRALDEVPAPAP